MSRSRTSPSSSDPPAVPPPRVDVHSHVVPTTLLGRDLRHGAGPSLHVSGDTGDVYVHGRRFRTVVAECWDMGRRSDAVAALGLERQVLSPMPELFQYDAAPADAVVHCTETNEWLAAATRASGGRFEGFGIVPLQRPDVAASMLGSFRDLGLLGVEIGSNVEGLPLHDARFASFFAEAERLGLVVFVHAFHPHGSDTLGVAAANGVLFPLEIGRALGGLLATGILARHPALRVLGSHGGGALASLLPRLDFVWDATPDLRHELTTRPSVTARSLAVDSLVYSAEVLDLVVRTLGAGAVLHGTDYPFLPAPAPPPSTLAVRMDRNAARLLEPHSR